MPFRAAGVSLLDRVLDYWHAIRRMRLDWLGDALDFWKGSILAILRSSAPKGTGLLVIPMFSDAAWSSDAVTTYASLLGVSPNSLCGTHHFQGRDRDQYFARAYEKLATSGRKPDVFVDPDTGIALSRVAHKHVSPAHLAPLLTTTNVVAVYQHRPQFGTVNWIGTYLDRVRNETRASVLAYQSAQVGMVFLTKSQRRRNALSKALSVRLGPGAKSRLRL